MHSHVVESIGSWGVVSTPAQGRLGRVRPGDIIDVPEGLRRYPISSRYSRIATIDEDGVAAVCEGMGSAFLLKDGSCDISGGPWWGVPVNLLEPAYEMKEATYWNWGGNSPGASQGIYYHIFRPVHRLTIHPDDVQSRYARTEQEARKGKYMHENLFGEDEWELFFRGTEADRDGEFRWVFRKIQPAVS